MSHPQCVAETSAVTAGPPEIDQEPEGLPNQGQVGPCGVCRSAESLITTKLGTTMWWPKFCTFQHKPNTAYHCFVYETDHAEVSRRHNR